MKNTGKLLRLLVENKEVKRTRVKYNFVIGIEILQPIWYDICVLFHLKQEGKVWVLQ